MKFRSRLDETVMRELSLVGETLAKLSRGKIRAESVPCEIEIEAWLRRDAIRIDAPALLPGHGRTTVLEGPHLGGLVVVDHHLRRTSPVKREEERRRDGGFRCLKPPQRAPKGPDHRLGSTRRAVCTVGSAEGRLAIVTTHLADSRFAGAWSRRLLQHLFPVGLFPSALVEELPSGLPVEIEIRRDNADGEALVVVTAIELELTDLADDLFDVPKDYRTQDTVREPWGDLFPADLINGLPTADLDFDLNPSPAFSLTPGLPVDAGLGFTPRFYRRLVEMASAVAETNSPVAAPDLMVDHDWFALIRQRLDDVGNITAADLDVLVEIGFGLTIQARFDDPADLPDLEEDFPELAAVLTEDERDALEAEYAGVEDAGDGNPWVRAFNIDGRNEIATRFARAGVLAPLTMDLRPDIPFDTPVMAGDVQVGRMMFLRDRNELWIEHLLTLMNIHIKNIRGSLYFADPLATNIRIEDERLKLDLENGLAAVDFDFDTSPAGTFVTAVVSVATLGVVYASLWNVGFGSYWVPEGHLAMGLRPEVDGIRIRHALSSNQAETEIAGNLTLFGWNPLGAIYVLGAQIFEAIAQSGVTGARRQILERLNDTLAEQDLLSFPAMLTVGDLERGRVDRILERPRFAESIVTDDESMFYRGIYRFENLALIEDPLVTDLEEDGAWFFHRAMFEDFVAARARLDGRRLGGGDLSMPDDHGLIPDHILQADGWGPDLLDDLVQAGLMTFELRDQWLGWLEARAPWLALMGYPNQTIALNGETELRNRTYLEVRARVAWQAGITSLPVGDPVGTVEVEVVAHNVLEVLHRFSASNRILDILRAWEDYWTYPELPPGVSIPDRNPSMPLFETSIKRTGQLHVGLWSQGQEVVSGLPPGFDFAVRDPADVVAGPTRYAVDDDDIGNATRAATLQVAAAEALATRLESLDRTLAQKGRYLSTVLSRIGFEWRVQDEDAQNLLVRTTRDHLYLDFVLDPRFIVDNLDLG